MHKFTLFYHGGKPLNAKQGAERQVGWDQWFRSLGDRLVDRGAPARSLGMAGEASSFRELPPMTGYSVISADSEEAAMKIAASCPIYNEGGAVEVARYVEPSRL